MCTTEKAAGVLKKETAGGQGTRSRFFHAGGVAGVREVALIVDELNPRGKDQDIVPTGGHVGKEGMFVRAQGPSRKHTCLRNRWRNWTLSSSSAETLRWSD